MEGWKAERSSGSGRKERDPCPAEVSPGACAWGEPLQVPLAQGKMFSMWKEAGAPAKADQEHLPRRGLAGARPGLGLGEFPSSLLSSAMEA